MAVGINQTFGDGSPSYKITYQPNTSWSWGTESDVSFIISGADLTLKCTSKDGNLNADPYANVSYFYRSVVFASNADGLVNPIGATKVWKTSHSASTYISALTFKCTADIYTYDAGSTYTPNIKVSSKFWREKLGIKIGKTTTNEASNSGTVTIPSLVRYFKYGISNGKFTNTQNHITITNTTMYKAGSAAGSFSGCPSRSYGNRFFTFQVPVTTNGSETISIVFKGVSGSANGDYKTISARVGKMSGLATISGSAYFKRGWYSVSISHNPRFFGSSTRVYTNRSGFLSSGPYIGFYAPGEPWAPANSSPSFSVANTTAQQVSTNQTKNVSLRITLNSNGVSRYWLSKMVYNVDLFWNDGTKIGSYIVNDSDMNNCDYHSTDFSTSIQVRNRMRQQDEYIYWTVSGYSVDTAGVTRWGTTSTTGKVNLFWSYIEPSMVSFNSSRISSSSGPNFSNNRAQLYYGGTSLDFVLQASINAWGDRPGTRNYEFSLNRNGVVKWFGRNITSDTGTKSHTYSYTIPDNWVNSSADFTVYKRLDNTEFLASGDPKNPSIGTNHSTGGALSFYETIGGVTGLIDIRPSILMVSIPSIVTGQGIFDKQSSQKVRYYVEVYDRDLEQVVNQYVLGSTSGDITKQVSIDLSSSSFSIPNPHLYELRLKADVTELLGNVHTYTFYTTTRQAFYPPRYLLTETSDSLLPPLSDTSLLIRQKATNTYTYKVDYDLVLSSCILNIEYYLASSPNVKRTKTLNIIPSNYSGGTFYGQYTFPNPSDLDSSDPLYDSEGFALGTQVKVWVSSTWNLPGVTSVYSNSSEPVYYNVTPTRFIYFITRNVEDEKWLNTLHSTTPTKSDKKSKKIFVETDIS